MGGYKMIVIDMNQISVASLMMHLHMNKGELEEDMVRHMILNSVRMYRTMFNEDYGEIVLAYDSRAYWRKEIFPQYKSNRRKNREEDDKDWDSIFGVLNNIKEEIKEFLPYNQLLENQLKSRCQKRSLLPFQRLEYILLELNHL